MITSHYYKNTKNVPITCFWGNDEETKSVKKVKKYTIEEQAKIDEELEKLLLLAPISKKLEIIEMLKPIKKQIDELDEMIVAEKNAKNPNYKKIDKIQKQIDEIIYEGSEKPKQAFWNDETIEPGM